MNEIISEPEIPRQVTKAMLVVTPRPIEILGRLKVVTFLYNRPCRSFRRIFTELLVKVPSQCVGTSLTAESVDATSSSRQLKAVGLARLNVLYSKGGKKL